MPTCALVVIFDLKNSVKAFIQSRGRARAAQSRLTVLCSEDGADDETLYTVLRQVRISMPAFYIRR